MKKNFFKGAALAALVFAGFSATAQEESKGIELSGSVDAYFKANANADQQVAPGTSFANQAGFALGMVNLIASKQAGKVGFVADLVFGPRGGDAVFGSGYDADGDDVNDASNASTFVNQLFVTYDVSDAVTLTFGNFNTYLGYEVISPTGNFNYSTSYMFSYGPFSHTGLKADFAIDDNWSVMASVMNPTDVTEFNPSQQYTGGLQLGYTNDSGSAYLNFLYGEQSRGAEGTFQVDLTTGWDVAEDFYLGLNTTYNTTDKAGNDKNGVSEAGFYGVALYPQYSFSDTFALGLRAEYFSEFGGEIEAIGDVFDDNGDADVFATTLTGSISIGSLTIKPELRLDAASEKVYTNENKNEKSLFSGVLGAVYSF